MDLIWRWARSGGAEVGKTTAPPTGGLRPGIASGGRSCLCDRRNRAPVRLPARDESAAATSLRLAVVQWRAHKGRRAASRRIFQELVSTHGTPVGPADVPPPRDMGGY